MRIRILFLAVLVSTIAVFSLSEVAWSSDVAPADVIYFDMAVDESRQLLYVSDWEGGSIHAVSMATLDVVSTVPVLSL
jgi:hypothetical protein